MKFFIFALALASLNCRAADVTVGSSAPVAVSIDQDGKPVDLAQVYKENKYVLIYFYPKADTPGCTAQACSLRDSYEALQKKGIVIYGVSLDDVKSQKAFQKKYKLPFNLLADEKKNVVNAFDVPSLMGYAKRQAFLVKEGKIVWLDREASTKEQAADILKYLDSENSKGEK
jgi:peroxiredoxin Q/BCP